MGRDAVVTCVIGAPCGGVFVPVVGVERHPLLGQ